MAKKKETNARKSKPSAKSQRASRAKNVKSTTDMTLPPLVATIVFVKDDKVTSGKGTAARSASAPTSPGGSVSSAGEKSKYTPRTSPEPTPAPTTLSKPKDEQPKQADKLSEPEDTQEVQSRFVTKKVRALNIAADGSVQRELIPGDQAKEESS